MGVFALDFPYRARLLGCVGGGGGEADVGRVTKLIMQAGSIVVSVLLYVNRNHQLY